MELKRNRLRIAGVAAAAVALFLLGMVPPALRARRVGQELKRANERVAEVTSQLERTRFDLDVARLRGALGEVLHEANRNNYGNAATRATAFFDDLRAAAASPLLEAESRRRQVLARLLGRRDEISADLARADPAVKPKLAEMYMLLGQAVAP